MTTYREGQTIESVDLGALAGGEPNGDYANLTVRLAHDEGYDCIDDSYGREHDNLTAADIERAVAA